MRSFILVLLFSLIGCEMAFADCSTTGDYKFATSYPYADFDVDASDGPVGQGGVTRSCGPWAANLWTSVGHGRAAFEMDPSLFYTRTAGPFRVQGSVQYYALNLDGNSLGNAKDDMVELYADASLPITRGKLTFAPLVRVIRVIGVRELRSQTVIQPGTRLSYRATDAFSANLDLRDSKNLTTGHDALRYEGGIAYTNGANTWTLGIRGASHTRAALSLGIVHQFREEG